MAYFGNNLWVSDEALESMKEWQENETNLVKSPQISSRTRFTELLKDVKPKIIKFKGDANKAMDEFKELLRLKAVEVFENNPYKYYSLQELLEKFKTNGSEAPYFFYKAILPDLLKRKILRITESNKYALGDNAGRPKNLVLYKEEKEDMQNWSSGIDENTRRKIFDGA